MLPGHPILVLSKPVGVGIDYSDGLFLIFILLDNIYCLLDVSQDNVAVTVVCLCAVTSVHQRLVRAHRVAVWKSKMPIQNSHEGDP